MKKLLLLLLILPFVFSSCGSDDEDGTSYQIVNNNSFESDFEDLDGSMYDVIVFCFIGDNVVREDHYDKISSMSKSEIKGIPDNFEKIKVSFKMLPNNSPYAGISSNVRKYTVSYTLIEKGKKNVVELTGNTLIQNNLKSILKSDNSESISSFMQYFK